jgi:hypothetical protein
MKIVLIVILILSILGLMLGLSSRENFVNPTLLYEDVMIPEMSSFSLPISEVFKIKANTKYFFKVELEANLTILGRLIEMNGTCINFYILDEINMKKFLANKSFSHAYVSYEIHGKANFTFITDKAMTYYFIIDNDFLRQGICHDKIVYLEVKIYK